MLSLYYIFHPVLYFVIWNLFLTPEAVSTAAGAPGLPSPKPWSYYPALSPRPDAQAKLKESEAGRLKALKHVEELKAQVRGMSGNEPAAFLNLW